MRVRERHAWNLTPHEAIALQQNLAREVITAPALAFEELRLVAGADVSSAEGDPLLTAGVVVCDADTLTIVETAAAQVPATFPYVPGPLAFREVPPILQALADLRTNPDVILVDGQGRAHPRRFGIACHVGLLVDRPTVGVAKTILTDQSVSPAAEAGSVAPLTDRGEEIGALVRTRAGVTPVVVSVGHRIDLPSAVAMALRLTRGTRLPEPLRLAHHHVNAFRRTGEGIPVTPARDLSQDCLLA